MMLNISEATYYLMVFWVK